MSSLQFEMKMLLLYKNSIHLQKGLKEVCSIKKKTVNYNSSNKLKRKTYYCNH